MMLSTYTPPKKWKKEAKGNTISYSTVNEKKQDLVPDQYSEKYS
jgi:hypothetical protein